MTGLAVMSFAARRRLVDTPIGLLRSGRVASGLAIIATGEYGADKLPFVPSRLSAGPLAGRLLLGGLCGALVAERENRSAGIVAGVLGAMTAAFAGHHLRRRISRTGARDLPVALVEDAIAVALAAGGVMAAR